jgi:WD40 repeat protein
VTAGQANYWGQFGVPTTDADHRYLAAASGGPGQVIDLETGELVFGYDGGISTLSSDGSFLLARGHGAGFALELVRLQDQERLWSFDKTFTRAWFSNDEEQVYGTSPDGSTYVIDAATGELILRLAGQDAVPIGATMSSDGQLLATFMDDLTARVWDLGEVLSEGEVYITHAEPRDHMAASADVAGGIAAVWAGLPRQEDQPWEINLIDLGSGELIRTLTGGAPALSGDGSRLAYRALEEVEVTDADLKRPGETGVLPRVGPVRIIDVGSGEVIHEFELRCEQYLMESEAVPSAGCTISRGGREWDLEFSSDGRMLAMADSYNDLMMVWDTDTGERIMVDDVPGANARTIQISPDGRQVVAHFSGGIDYRMGVYNVGSIDGSVIGRQADSIRFPDGTSFAELVFIPDGSLVVAADNTGNLTLIDPATWEPIEPIAAHDGAALDVAINPAGTFIASGGEDAYVRVWSLADRSLVTEIKFDVDEIANVEFIDDAHLFVTAGLGSEAIVITLDPDELIDIARSRLIRSFTAEECAQFGIEPCPTLEEIKGGSG